MKNRKRKDLIRSGVIDKEGNITPSFVLSKHNYTPDEIKRHQDYELFKIQNNLYSQNEELRNKEASSKFILKIQK
jgi:hypothetical protein